MWHSSWTTTSSIASSGLFMRKQEKQRLFLPLQLPYRVLAEVTRKPVGVTPIFSLQYAILAAKPPGQGLQGFDLCRSGGGWGTGSPEALTLQMAGDPVLMVGYKGVDAFPGEGPGGPDQDPAVFCDLQRQRFAAGANQFKWFHGVYLIMFQQGIQGDMESAGKACSFPSAFQVRQSRVIRSASAGFTVTTSSRSSAGT